MRKQVGQGRRTQEALRQSEERFRLLVAHALDAVITIDIQGRITSWNPQAERLFGWAQAEVLGRLLSETIIPPTYREAHERGLARFRATGEGPVLGRRIELTALHRNGTEFPVELAITPMRSGKTVLFSAFLRDITEAKRAEEARRQSEASFRVLFTSNPLPMWVYDVATMAFLEVNAAAVAHYGYSREEFLAMRITDIRPPEEVPRLEAILTGFGAEADPAVRRHAGTWTHRLKDGRIREVDIVSHAIDFAGRRAALVVAIDVTELRQTQASLAKSTERLRILHEIDRALIAAEAPVAIAEAVLRRLRDLLGVPRAIVNLFDLATGEVEWLAAAGRRRIRLGPGVRFPLSLMGDVEALRRGEPQVIDVAALPRGPEAEALLASGVHVYMVVPMIAGGELIGGLSFGGARGPFPPEQVSIVQEVATPLAMVIAQARLYERVKHYAEELEERVRERTAELEAANRELEAFTYTVSHDLRVPLRAADGFSRILLEEYAPHLVPEAQRYLRLVRESTQQMGQLIADLLTFSRLSRQPLNGQAIVLTDLVHQVLEDLRAAYAGRRLDIVIGDLPVCRADVALLKQVLINLLSNAIKFTSKRESASIEVGCQRLGGQPVYFIKDNGVAIDMRYAYRLFGVFQRLHRVAEYEGTGVGLAIVQRIIHRHGGRIWAEAAVDQGATFYFTLGDDTSHA